MSSMNVSDSKVIVVSILYVALLVMCLVAIICRGDTSVRKKQRTPRHAEDDMGEDDVPSTETVDNSEVDDFEGIDDGLLL